MFSSLAKIIAAGFSVAAPFVAGCLVSNVAEAPAATILAVVGAGLGLISLAVFCSLDSAEVIAHLRRLNPGLKVPGGR